MSKKIHEETENGNGIIADDEFFIAISHEIRRVIIITIGDNGFAGFSQFKRAANAGTGTIYHHIEVLRNFVYQDSKKKYHLTEAGIRAYNLLISQDKGSLGNFRTMSIHVVTILGQDGRSRLGLSPLLQQRYRVGCVGVSSLCRSTIHN